MSQKKWQICGVSRLHILCHSDYDLHLFHIYQKIYLINRTTRKNIHHNHGDFHAGGPRWLKSDPGWPSSRNLFSVTKIIQSQNVFLKIYFLQCISDNAFLKMYFSKSIFHNTFLKINFSKCSQAAGICSPSPK